MLRTSLAGGRDVSAADDTPITSFATPSAAQMAPNGTLIRIMLAQALIGRLAAIARQLNTWGGFVATINQPGPSAQLTS